MAETLFELKDVHYSYLGRFPALCGVTMEVRCGDNIALLGANGTGKSTLLALLDGLLTADAGSVSAFGRALNAEAFADREFVQMFRRSVGFVFQNPDVQLFCPTVREDICFGPLQLGMPEAQVQRRLDELAAAFGIGDLLERPPHYLSLGEKRKVALASTLILDPAVLLLDEPTAGLDPRTTRQITDIIASAHEAGRTVVTATHDLHLVEAVADTIAVFERSHRIARRGAAEEILADQPFLAQHNLVHEHVHRHRGQVHSHPHIHQEHHEDH